MAYSTSNILSPQRLRKAAGEQHVMPSDPAFALTADSLVGLISGLVVPAEYFNATRYTNEAGARTAFKAAAFGIVATGTKLGESIPVVCYWKGIVEFDVDDAAFVPGTDFLTLAWDATASNLMSQKWKKTATTPYMATVDKGTPMQYGQYGATTSPRVAGTLDIERYRGQ